jgi:hypothetical protein
LLEADTAAIRRILNVDATPTTLTIEDGVITREYVGLLSAPAKKELMTFIKRD